ncbi:hypothetical protein VNI00_016504 [Paramarasmius palmivorus]|uniref:Uncharacterized protein n=1 Tax=Paramarasmius palmivorus TaxID=297713 RepID=A0AAW0BFU3_9AGAR
MVSAKSKKGKSKAPPPPQVQRIHVEKVHRTAAFLKVEALTQDGRRVRQRVVKVSGLSPVKKRTGTVNVPQFDSMMMDIDERVDDLVLGEQGLFVNAGVDTVEDEGNIEIGGMEKQGQNHAEGELGKTMADWRPMARDFLEELMKLEGRPEEHHEVCWTCKTFNDTLYRCRDCIQSTVYRFSKKTRISSAVLLY